METHCHDAVGVVEGLLDPVSVVDVDIEVEHSVVEGEELHYAEDDIVDVAESTGLAHLCMVVPSRPVYHHIPQATHHCISCVQTSPGSQPTEME